MPKSSKRKSTSTTSSTAKKAKTIKDAKQTKLNMEKLKNPPIDKKQESKEAQAEEDDDSSEEEKESKQAQAEKDEDNPEQEKESKHAQAEKDEDSPEQEKESKQSQAEEDDDSFEEEKESKQSQAEEDEERSEEEKESNQAQVEEDEDSFEEEKESKQSQAEEDEDSSYEGKEGDDDSESKGEEKKDTSPNEATTTSSSEVTPNRLVQLQLQHENQLIQIMQSTTLNIIDYCNNFKKSQRYSKLIGDKTISPTWKVPKFKEEEVTDDDDDQSDFSSCIIPGEEATQIHLKASINDMQYIVLLKISISKTKCGVFIRKLKESLQRILSSMVQFLPNIENNSFIASPHYWYLFQFIHEQKHLNKNLVFTDFSRCGYVDKSFIENFSEYQNNFVIPTRIEKDDRYIGVFSPINDEKYCNYHKSNNGISFFVRAPGDDISIQNDKEIQYILNNCLTAFKISLSEISHLLITE
jgi:hypothetical protein